MTHCWFYLPTVIASGFVAAHIGAYMCKKELKNIRESVDGETYKKVVNERKEVYFNALIKSIVVAILYLLLVRLTHKKNNYHLSADVLCIVLTFSFLFYLLTSKKHTLLRGDNTSEWLASYYCMEKHYWTWFILGAIVSSSVLYLHDVWSH